jgi:hypothetical protein
LATHRLQLIENFSFQDARTILPYLNVLERGELKLAFDADQGEFSLWYWQHRYPIDPVEYPRIPSDLAEPLGERLGQMQPPGQRPRTWLGYSQSSWLRERQESLGNPNMKAVVAALLLTFVCGAVQADWIKTAESDEATYYSNPATLEKDDDIRRAWEIHDYRKHDPDGEMSLRLHVEYDCKASKYRLLGFSTHSEPMAEGKTLVSNSNTGEWVQVPPDTLVDRNIKLYCGH